MELIIASNNAHKVKEIKEILGDFFDGVFSMKEVGVDVDVEETGDTFFANALLKARAISELTGKICLADDSGLRVDYLNGAPGVYSARYAGNEHNDDKNIDKLLLALEGVENREANFTSTLVVYYPNGDYLTVDGVTEGEITLERKGTNGFGYDPVFFSYELNKTFGEATDEEKNRVSHRGKALKKLKAHFSN